MLERLSFPLAMKGFVFQEHIIGPSGNFLGQQGIGNGEALLPFFVCKPSPDHRIILSGFGRGLPEGHFQISVPVFPAAVRVFSPGVMGLRHSTRIGEEMPHGGEALDAIDFQVDRQGCQQADSGEGQQMLDLRSVYQLRAELGPDGPQALIQRLQLEGEGL